MRAERGDDRVEVLQLKGEVPADVGRRTRLEQVDLLRSSVKLCNQGSTRRLGRALRMARDNQGLSQEDLAGNAGVSRTYIGEIERGEKCPSVCVG